MLVPIYRKATVLRRQSGSFPCRLTEIPVPVWPCLLPSCPTSDDPQSLNAAGMQQRAVLLHFNFSPCIVLSCLVLFTSAPPSPSPSSASSSSHALSTLSTLWLGTRAAVQCASFSPRALPCQLASLPVLPACPPCLRPALCCTVHRHIWVLCAYSTYCAVSSCRLQEPYCWNHTTRVLYLLDDCPAGRCVICVIRFDPLHCCLSMTQTDVCNKPIRQQYSSACSPPAYLHT